MLNEPLEIGQVHLVSAGDFQGVMIAVAIVMVALVVSLLWLRRRG